MRNFNVMTPGTKDKIQYSTAVVMLMSGVILTFCSYFMQGDVVEGVLWYAGQTMVYAGSIFGVTMYVRVKSGELKNYIDKKINSNEQ